MLDLVFSTYLIVPVVLAHDSGQVFASSHLSLSLSFCLSLCLSLPLSFSFSFSFLWRFLAVGARARPCKSGRFFCFVQPRGGGVSRGPWAGVFCSPTVLARIPVTQCKFLFSIVFIRVAVVCSSQRGDNYCNAGRSECVAMANPNRFGKERRRRPRVSWCFCAKAQ